MSAPRAPRGAAALLLALLAAACGAPPRKPTAAEWLRENTVILEQLRSYDRKERQEGIHRFLKLGREQGTEVVVYLLGDPALDDYRIEVVLARILAEWKDARAIPYLVRNLRSRDEGATGIARDGLSIFVDEPRVLTAAGELLVDPEAATRRVAATLLSEMKGEEAVRLLGEHLPAEEDGDIRGTCLLGVLESHHPRRTEFLVNALSDPDPDIRVLSWEALAPSKPPVRFDPLGAPAGRSRAVAALRRWAGLRGERPGPPAEVRQAAAR